MLCALAIGTSAGDDDLVFRSDVSLVRVDAQVVDASNRAIIHLHAGDFVLRADGREVPIRNFASENMPVDVLFLLDVSGSMRPHVQRIADASGQALTELGNNDRMGIMVFDRNTRVRLAFNSNRDAVQREFDRLLRDERFNGGTDITRAMLDAADYMRENGRRDARRAIVILTDDQTEFDRDDMGVGHALAHANAVMCALIAPDATQNRGNRGGGQRREGGAVEAWAEGWVASFLDRAAAETDIRAEEEWGERTLNRPARRRSHAIPAATACRLTTPRRWLIRWSGFAGATRCISACPMACSPARNAISKWISPRKPAGVFPTPKSTTVGASSRPRAIATLGPPKLPATRTANPQWRIFNGSIPGPTDPGTSTVHRRRVAVNEDGTPIASPDQQ